MGWFWNAFSTWNRQNVLSETHLEGSAKRLNNALEAEDKVANAIRELGYTHVHTRRRVYVESQNRNREIDVVAVTPRNGIYVIEVKNWTGSVWRNGVRWYQMPNPNGRAMEFEDLFDECKFKAKALGDYLRRKKPAEFKDLSDDDIHPILVFTNPKVKLCPNSVQNMKDVFTIKSLAKQLGQADGWFASNASYYLPSALFGGTSSTYFTPTMQTSVSESLDRLRTWDTVVLHNGQTIHGDILSIEAPNVGVHYDREHITNMTIEWGGSSIWGLAWSIWKGSAAFVKVNLTSAKLKKIKRNDKKPRDAKGNIRFPLSCSKKKDRKLNDRILMRPAGKPGVEDHALADIKAIGFQGRDAIKD